MPKLLGQIIPRTVGTSVPEVRRWKYTPWSSVHYPDVNYHSCSRWTKTKACTLESLQSLKPEGF